MITKKLLRQAIKETAEGMLSGDPDYACKCVQARDGSRVRVIGWMPELCCSDPILVLYEYADGKWIAEWHRYDGAYLQSGVESRHDLIPVPRKLKCWVRFSEAPNNVAIACTHLANENWPDRPWLTGPIEVTAEKKVRLRRLKK